MSATANIEASLRLEIAQYQEQLARAKGDAAKWREKLQQESKGSASAIKTVADALANSEAKARQLSAVNPWASNTAAASQYAAIVQTKVVTAMQAAAAASEAAASKAMRAQFLGGSMGGEFDSNNVLAQQAQADRNAGRGGAGGSRRGAGGFAAGNVAMQAQDIAVQLQMGTKASIVFAQQAPQLLSAFGPTGMIVGGIAAIGGALYTMGENSKADFAKAKTAAAEFDAVMEKAARGTVADLTAAIGQAADRTKALALESQSIATGGLMPAIQQMLGGANVADKITLNADEGRKALEYRRELGALLAAASDDETRVAQLRAQGHEEEAAALEREIALKRELNKISQLQVDGFIKEQLAANAIAQSAASAADPAATKRAKEDILRIQEKFKEEQLAALDPAEKYLTLAKQQEAIFASMADKGGMFYEANAIGLEAWVAALEKSGKTEQHLAALKMLDQSRAIEAQMKAANQSAQDDTASADRERDAANQRKQEAADKAKQQLQETQAQAQKRADAKAELAELLAIKKAKDEGNQPKADALQREHDIKQKARDIAASTDLTPAQARRAAEQLMSDTSIPPSGKAKRGRMMGIGDEGALAPRGRRAGRMMGGLDDFYELQAGTTGSLGKRMGKSAVGMGMYDPLLAQAESNTTRADAAARTVSFSSREFETLTAIKDGIEKLLG